MNYKRIYAVARKDILDVISDKESMLAITLLPLIMSVFMPLLLIIIFKFSGEVNNGSDLNKLLSILPNEVLPDVGNTEIKMLVVTLTILLAPIFLMIPVMIASVIASYSFIGEKENKTLEGLMYTPVTNTELIIAKALGSFVPSILITALSIVIYAVIVNSATGYFLGYAISLNLNWLVMAILLVPAVTVLSILIIILVSFKVKTARAAQSISSLIAFPILALVISQVSGVFYFGLGTQIILAGVLLLIDIALLIFVSNKINREKFLVS